MMMIGFGGFAVGTWWASFITSDWDFYELLVPQILRGCSLMLCMVPINNIALGSLRRSSSRTRPASTTSPAISAAPSGLAVINTMLNTRTDLHITGFPTRWWRPDGVAEEAIANTAQRFIDYGDAAQAMALALINQRVHEQALVMAFGDVFLGLTMIFASLVG